MIDSHLFALGALSIFGIASVFRFLYNGPRTPIEPILLEKYEIAYLSGGPEFVIDVAVAGLIQQKQVKVFSIPTRIKKLASGEGEPDWLQQKIIELVDFPDGIPYFKLKEHQPALLQKMESKLKSLKLIATNEDQDNCKMIGYLATILTTIIGATLASGAKDIGLRGDLIFLTILFTIAQFYLLVPTLYQTSSGRELLRKLRRQHKTDRELHDNGSNSTQSMAVFGMGILYESRFRYIYALLDTGNEKRARFIRMDAELGIKQIEYDDEEADRKRETGY